ncbi:MAG: hypothetical protein K1X47_11265 [Cyclobacteriaceae bacterium]|nr:hypothetical protein [Cyclobacteriaceae bacterium]
MSVMYTSFKSGAALSRRSIRIWRVAQTGVWLIGAGIFVSLLAAPKVGLLVFWNILIPVAPALIVVAVGLWRNVCPMATTTLLPRHLGLSNRKKMSGNTAAILGFVAVMMLFIIVPLRHAVFNVSGPATAMLLAVATGTGLTMGFFYEWKSAWCSSLCPIHPVERLYGGNVVMSLPNAHCGFCMKCVSPCPDSTANFSPGIGSDRRIQRIGSFILVGGLPGFIWGWFQTPDQPLLHGAAGIFEMYRFPIAGMSATLIVYALLRKYVAPSGYRLIDASFAAAAVSCYYWFRIPALIGFGVNGKDGLLYDLHSFLPSCVPLSASVLVTLFFFWWIVIRKPNGNSWTLRPAYGDRNQRHA